MNAIILVVDRLHAGYVGAYGNTWIETPWLDRLASQATVFDQCLIESPDLEGFCRSCWLGRHPLCPSDGQGPLPRRLADAGVATALLTDDPAIARHRLARTFDAVVRLDVPEFPQVADQIEETHLAGSFARIVDWLEAAREPFLLWCHLTGLGGPWDAPLAFRLRYAEGDDPDPPDSADVPCRMLEEDYDPDQLLGVSQAYAGQVTLLDVCLGALLEFLDESPLRNDTSLALVSARGFPLGEHRRVGAYDDALYGELVHAPFVMRFADLSGEAVRSPAFVQPADLYPTLLDCWGIAGPPAPTAASLMPLIREEAESVRDRLCIVNQAGQRAIRTPAWYLRDGDPPELFRKPDDRWEVNDVSDRCEQVVDLLRKTLAACEDSFRQGGTADLPPLDELLVAGLE